MQGVIIADVRALNLTKSLFSVANSSIAAVILVTNAAGQTQLSSENAYNPIPSPDGSRIVAVRTGWFRPGGSGGLGRSNLRSDIIILDRTGRTLSAAPLSDSFVADWTSRGIVAFRDWSYALLTENGSIREQGRVCPPGSAGKLNSGCVERVAYLAKTGSFVWVDQQFADSVLTTPRGELSPHHHDKFLGEWLVPSPDERYLAAGPGRLSLTLNIYDVRERTWHEFGNAIIHPYQGWNWFEPSWSPWFADSSQLAFFTAQGLVVSSPDGKQRRIVLRTAEPAGLAAPSPDGRRIAYATYAARPRTSGTGNTPVWNCTGIWLVGLEKSAQPQRLVGNSSSLTYDLRWLDDDHLVFDRIEDGIPPRARIWVVTARH